MQRATPQWPLSIPIYEPMRYWFSGLEYHELPELARDFLQDMITNHYQPRQKLQRLIEHKHRELAIGLALSLQGNDGGLVRLRHQARSSFVSLSQCQSREVETGVAESRVRDEHRIKEVLEVLIPHRKQILDDFMVRFDALIWYELKPTENQMPKQEQESYRGARCKPILEGTYLALGVLDRKMMSLPDGWGFGKENEPILGSKGGLEREIRSRSRLVKHLEHAAPSANFKWEKVGGSPKDPFINLNNHTSRW